MVKNPERIVAYNFDEMKFNSPVEMVKVPYGYDGDLFDGVTCRDDHISISLESGEDSL